MRITIMICALLFAVSVFGGKPSADVAAIQSTSTMAMM